MFMKLFCSSSRIAPLFVTGVLILSVRLAAATDHMVNMSTYVFSPNYLEIQPGDTVTWHNDDGFEDLGSRSDTDLWDTGGVGPDADSEPVLFSTTGTFPYYDPTYGDAFDMIGTIVVKEATAEISPATLTDAQLLPDGSFRFTITNLTAGKDTVVELSTNLTAWTPILTNVSTSDSMSVTNPASANSAEFYRSYQIP
jgi:plastocyanin